MTAASPGRLFAPPRSPDAAIARQWEAECAGKEVHASEAAAEAVLALIKRSRTARRACWLNSYCCSFCGSWHLGHTRRAL